MRCFRVSDAARLSARQRTRNNYPAEYLTTAEKPCKRCAQGARRRPLESQCQAADKKIQFSVKFLLPKTTGLNYYVFCIYGNYETT
jgi:hypothetical protein